MEENYKDRVVVHARLLFTSLSYLKESEYEKRSKGIVQLREASHESNIARSKLRSLIYDDDDALVRILAAEALSQTKSFPLDAIPVLQAVLDVCRENNLISTTKDWLRVSLGALANFGELAVSAEYSVWPYIYNQDDLNLQLYAIKVIAKIAKLSEASWTILCLLCRHENSVISQFTRDIMKSHEFKDYIAR